MKLPLYMSNKSRCRSKEVIVCGHIYMKYCPNTCAYALEIGAIGIGAIRQEGLPDGIEKCFEQDEIKREIKRRFINLQ